MTLSLCMIVKDEELVLERCLNSCKNLFDEIIIVDTGSTDKTIEIAKEFTNKVYNFTWCYDFSKARNFSISKATKDYIMWLDADDIIEERELEKLIKLKNNMDNIVDIYMLKYYLKPKDNNTLPLTFYRERLFKNDGTFKFVSPIHEVITPHGNIKYEDIYITHKKEKEPDVKRNLEIFEKMIKANVKFDARQTFYYARELYYNNRLNKAIKTYTTFLKMDNAYIQNKINACIDLYNIYNLKNKPEIALSYIFKTFTYEIPRSETCSYIGNYFIQNKKYDMAIFWYKNAINNAKNYQNGGFYISDYEDFIPYINLCVCYFYKNDIKKAIYYNNLAGSIRPNNETYLYNYNLLKNYNF